MLRVHYTKEEKFDSELEFCHFLEVSQLLVACVEGGCPFPEAFFSEFQNILSNSSKSSRKNAIILLLKHPVSYLNRN